MSEWQQSGDDSDNITGPFLDKPKPIEVWAILTESGTPFFRKTRQAAEELLELLKGARLVHLIEVEDKP